MITKDNIEKLSTEHTGNKRLKPRLTHIFIIIYLKNLSSCVYSACMTPDSKEKRFRSAPSVWQDIIKSIVNDTYDGRAITYEMIESVVQEHNHSISRDSLRVKMVRYIKSGYVRPAVDPKTKKRVRGAFWLTEDGKLFFGLKTRPLKGLKETAVLPTPPSPWSQKALNIKPADATAR